MKQGYSSFISEHTAEYVLVPRLTNILKQKFEIVIPIFPWMSREGNNLSRKIHGQEKFSIVGVYPKRPKIILTDQKLLIKINDEFVRGSKAALNFNVPMIVGCPLVRSLWDLNESTSCVWITLDDSTRNSYTVEYKNKTSSIYKVTPTKSILKNEGEILKFISKGANDQDFERFLEMLRCVKEESRSGYWVFGGGYKPVYFLIKGDKTPK